MKTLTSPIALMLALMLGVPNAVLAADAPAATKTKQLLEQGCKENDGTWAARGAQGGVCTVKQDPTAKKKKKQTLEQWCKSHGGTWTSDGYQGGSCAL